MNTGEALRQKRLSKKISLRKLSSMSGVATATIYRIEKNISKPHKSTEKAIESALEESTCQTINNTEKQ